MTNSVTFPTNLGGDGSTVTDDDNASTGLGNGGHRTRFVPAMGQVVAVANVLTQRLAAQSDTSTTSTAIASGSKSFTTAGFYEWAVGMYVIAASAANPTNLMYGQVTSWTTATNVLVVNVLSVGGSGTYSDWTLSLAGPPNLSTLPAIISVTSTSAALRVTQLGTGNALLIEDSTNPDSTPVVVDASGNLVNGHTAALAALAGVTPQLQTHGTTDSLASNMVARWSADANPAKFSFAKSRGAAPGTYTIVASGDDLGSIDFLGANGTAFIQAAQIMAEVDGTPGAADMPGRLLFFTTADGASTPTERMRIDSFGNLGLGVTPSASVARSCEVGDYTGLTDGPGGGGGYGLLGNAYEYSSNAYKYRNSYYSTMYRTYAGQHQWYTAPSGTAGNAISFTQAMTLDASGNLLVGATSTIASSRCVIKKDNDTQLTLDANNSGSGVFTTLSFANQGTVKTQVYWSSTSSNFAVQNGTGGVYLATNGTSWTSASDERLKTDLKPIENAAQKVSSLRAVTGRYKTDDEGVSRSFLIAQDVQAVLPEAVDASDPDKLGVQYTDTIPLLVAAIKELSAELNELKGKIA